ncbi:TIGR02221 family CRISPR-associated protein [Algoriphagus chordae]|uniref:CRISPR-associated Csx2 family protein n=1 Tax=Algoriphagus chordae TaxID=237019 RepID=A0A2W7QIG3_9BACT|nr:TIGR02221 family CRISPR-associated protein [Algoriphagus chordae]PZX48284.1 CRISPR-associated Csx2 family protein [Algoriphagus chordae]
MARKVFLSFLGLGKYQETDYFFDQKKDNSFKTPFIQEAILKHLISNDIHDIKPIIFLTKEAYQNWNINDFNKGLKCSLSKINKEFGDSNYEIPSGTSQEQIWKIFKVVFDQLEDHDEVFFDITHGFRSLPMLAIVLLNYAKFLKNIKVQGVYYGAYDARETVGGLSYTPVWDLKSFSAIQDWTNAANQFLKTGNGLMLSDLIEDTDYFNLKDSISQFSKEILVNRGPEIFKGTTQLAIQKELQTLDLKVNDPLKYILKRVKSHFDEYQENSIINGLNAVKWCIDNGLIQQGATLLEEFATTYVLVKIGKGKLMQNPDVRGFVSAALSVAEGSYRYMYLDPNNPNIKQIEKYQKLSFVEKDVVPTVYLLDNYKALKCLVNDIKSSIRNDVNHAGFREAPKTYDGMKKSLVKRYEQFLNLL